MKRTDQLALVVYTLGLSASGCGGQTAQQGLADSGGGPIVDTGTALDSGGGPIVDTGIALDSSGGNEAQSTLPQVGSSACDMQQGCVLCNDDNWHCQTEVFPPCPSGIEALEANAPCDGGIPPCVSCGARGMGDEWLCVAIEPDHWEKLPLECTQ